MDLENKKISVQCLSLKKIQLPLFKMNLFKLVFMRSTVYRLYYCLSIISVFVNVYIFGKEVF